MAENPPSKREEYRSAEMAVESEDSQSDPEQLIEDELQILPTLSVVMPNYNNAQYLDLSLTAILEQSQAATEVIVVDDGSSDDSVSKIEGYAEKHSNLRLVRNESNMGCLAAFHRGYELCTGDYVYAASANDRVLPGLFEKSLKMLKEYPDAALCCSYPASFRTVGDEGRIVLDVNPNYWSERPRYFSPSQLAEVLAGGYIAGHTSLVRRQAFEDSGGFIQELKWHSDWFSLLVMGFRHGICYIPEPLASIRVDGDSYSLDGCKDEEQQEDVLCHLLSILKSPVYSDVIHHFARSGALNHFYDQIVNVVMNHSEYWDLMTLMLIQIPLHEWCRKQHQTHIERAARAYGVNEAMRHFFA